MKLTFEEHLRNLLELRQEMDELAYPKKDMDKQVEQEKSKDNTKDH